MGRPGRQTARPREGHETALERSLMRLTAVTLAIVIGALAGIVIGGIYPADGPPSAVETNTATAMKNIWPAQPATDEEPRLPAAETAALAEIDETVSVHELVDRSETGSLTAEAAAPEGDTVAAAPSFGPDGQPLRPGRTRDDVNLRAGPDNRAAVLVVVPADSDLMAEKNCDYWCSVEYEGHRGYIYKTFIRDGGTG